MPVFFRKNLQSAFWLLNPQKSAIDFSCWLGLRSSSLAASVAVAVESWQTENAPRGKGLATYAETQALIDKLEHERTHRDSQVLEKYLDIDFASSTGATKSYKLLDGVRDVVGWCAKAKDPWVEFSFTKEPMRFSRLRLYGSGIENMKVSIRKGGDWKELEPKSVRSEKYMRQGGCAARVCQVRSSWRFAQDSAVHHCQSAVC